MVADFQAAMAARSLRTIRAELEFLAETSHITPSQLSTILSNLPASDLPAITSSLSSVALNPTRTNDPISSPISTPASNNPYNEKTQSPLPPPTYSASPAYTHPPTLSTVIALYPYTATDSGDLSLQPNDTINVTEYVNADWWRGVNPVTGQTGIFPKAYVKPKDTAEKEKDGYGYGNLPLQVSNSGSGPSYQPHVQPQDEPPSKMNEQGKKFGKKLGNAAIFGAGATIGGKIVNGIF